MRIKNTYLALIAVLLSPMAATADTIPVDFSFDDSDWSGTATFDDTTGLAWDQDLTLMAYLINSMTISWSGVATWDESEISAGAVLPTFGMLVDSFGRAALFTIAQDTVTGIFLFTGLNHLGDGIINSSELFADPGSGEISSRYTARVSVPEPGTLALLGIGLFGIGLARRRRIA